VTFSPRNVTSPKVPRAPTTEWTPTAVASPNVQQRHEELPLVWNGHTKAEFSAMHQDAHGLDRTGELE
jgi:hypothetical protein